jgi:hypothetical protein
MQLAVVHTVVAFHQIHVLMTTVWSLVLEQVQQCRQLPLRGLDAYVLDTWHELGFYPASLI